MAKEEVQQRVLKNGKPLPLDKFEWDEKTKTFSSIENGLTLDFSDVHGVVFSTRSNCTFKTGSHCTFDTGGNCTFDTDGNCTFDTGSSCTFKAGSYCTFDTGGNCTFKTEYNCVFNVRYVCTFDTGEQCVIVRRDEFQVITPEPNEKIQLCPSGVPGYISQHPDEDQYHMEVDGQRIPHIIADEILSRVINRRGNVYRVINDGETKESWLVTDSNDNWSHGSTLREAKDDLIYKITTRDLGQFKSLKFADTLDFEQAVSLYRSITGSCSSGTRHFIKQHNIESRPYQVNEIIELTAGQYGHQKFIEFFS